MPAPLIPLFMAANGAAASAPFLYTLRKNGSSGPNELPGTPSNIMSSADQLAYLNSLQASGQTAVANPSAVSGESLNITPTVHMDKAGNFSIGLTPQNQESIIPQVTPTPASTSVSVPAESTATATPAQSTATTKANTQTAPTSDIDTLVKATLRGNYGNGADRKKALGANYEAVQKAINGMNLPKATGSKTNKSKTKEPSVAENLNKNSGNWMDSLSGLLPLLAIGAGAYYWGKH